MKIFSILILLTAAAVTFGQAKPAPAPQAPPVAPRANVMVWHADGGYLGIVAVGITNENFSQFGLRDIRGVGVEKVVEDSPAAKAGLQANDVVIRFDGEEVKSVAKLTRMISEAGADQTVRLTVLRGGQEREITATVGKRSGFNFDGFNGMGAGQGFGSGPVFPQGEFKLNDEFFKNMPKGEFPKGFPGSQGNFVWNVAPGRRIGISSEQLTKQLGEYFGVADGKGLLVSEVIENSPAAKAGLKAGDVIVEADGKKVSDAMELVRAINAKKEGDIEITFIRDRNRQTVRITPEQSKEGPALFQTEPGLDGMQRTLVTPRVVTSRSPVDGVVPAAISIVRKLRCIL